MTKSKFRPKETAKKGRKKKEKLSLVFDPDARKEFLNGFRKRKQKKKADFKLRMEKKVAAEKLRIRAEAKKSVKKVSASHSILPEVEALLADQLSNFSTSDSFDIGSKTVTISNVDTIKPVILDGNNSDESEDEDNEDTPEAHPHLNAIKTKTLLKKSTNRLLQNSKVYKAAQRLKQKKSKHHQRHPPGKNSKDSKVDPKASAEVAGKQFRGKPQKSRGRRGRGKK